MRRLGNERRPTHSAEPPASDGAARNLRPGPSAGAAGPAADPWAGWSCPPSLFFAVFAVLPLLGVVALSFTNWDGIGAISMAGAGQLAHRPVRPRHVQRGLADLRDHGGLLAGADADQPAAGHFHCRQPEVPGSAGRALLPAAAALLGSHRHRLQGAAGPQLRAGGRPRTAVPGTGLARPAPTGAVPGDLRDRVAVRSVPHPDLPGRCPADPQVPLRGCRDRRRGPGEAVLLHHGAAAEIHHHHVLHPHGGGHR